MLSLTLVLLAAQPSFCDEKPNHRAAASHGRPAKGSVDGAEALIDSEAVRILPARHRERCLNWGTPRLVHALERAGTDVQKKVAQSPVLGVGNIGRPQGGSLAPYSHSHQAGRDCDISFYAVNARGPVAAEDLEHFTASLRSVDGNLRFDVERNWALVESLLRDDSIDIEWIFVSNPLKKALLAHAKATGVPAYLLSAAEERLHQPSDAPPHDDHFHLRLRCTASERATGCVD